MAKGNCDRAKACKHVKALSSALKDALYHLEEFIGSDCECDNTHEQNGTTCCLCEYRKLLAEIEGA